MNALIYKTFPSFQQLCLEQDILKKTKYNQAIDDKGLIAAVKRPVFKNAVNIQVSYGIFKQIFQENIFSIQNLYTAQTEGKKSLFYIKRTYTETWHRIKNVVIRKTIF